jgi:hypothetical protein
MNHLSIGIPTRFERDAGTLTLYSLTFPGETDVQSVATVLASIPIESEVSVLDPANGDCELEVKRAENGYATKRGCHGAFGTWHKASLQEAATWLLPGIVLAIKRKPSYANASLAVPKAKDGA